MGKGSRAAAPGLDTGPGKSQKLLLATLRWLAWLELRAWAKDLLTGKQLDEVGLAGKIPGIPRPELRLARVMPRAGGLVGSGPWRYPPSRVATSIPTGPQVIFASR